MFYHLGQWALIKMSKNNYIFALYVNELCIFFQSFPTVFKLREICNIIQSFISLVFCYKPPGNTSQSEEGSWQI